MAPNWAGWVRLRPGWGWLRVFSLVLAAVVISLAATGVLVLIRPDRAITLLIYLPGITVVDALFGVWGGIAAVLLSVAGSAACRIWFLANPLQLPVGFYATWEEEFILLVVGLFVVALMELRRRSGMRAAVGAHQMAALLEHVADAVIIFGKDMRVNSLNPAADALFDRPGETLLGLSAASLRERFHFVYEGGKTTRTPTLEETTQAGVSTHDEGTIIDVERNRRIHVLVSSTPLRNAGREIIGSLVLITDVTALKELQLRTLDSARHLAIAQMVSGLTHDFNHVLDIIRRAVAVLEIQEDAPTAERRKFRDMIDRAAQDGAAIVHRLRDYLVGGAGPTQAVDVTQLAREAIELTRPLWRTHTEIEVVEDLHPVPSSSGSAHDLRRVLVNLIFNAVEALGGGGGTIRVHTGLAGNDSQRILAWVEDTGPGIPEDVQHRLFQPYFTTKPQGMGLGLFGAQKIVLAHNGTLSFVSTPGRGTRFLMELPVAEAPPRRDAA